MDTVERDREIVAAVVNEVYEGLATYKDIGARYRLTRERIRQIVQKTDLYRPGGCGLGTPLTEAEQAAILRLHQRDMPIAHIAQTIERSNAAVAKFLIDRDLHTPATDDRAWSDAETEFLRSTYGKESAARIGKALGRTKNEVIGKANRLGLTKPVDPDATITAQILKVQAANPDMGLSAVAKIVGCPPTYVNTTRWRIKHPQRARLGNQIRYHRRAATA